MALSLDFWTFFSRFRNAYSANRRFSNRLCEIIATDQNFDFPQMVACLERALSLDATIMGLTASLNDRWQQSGWYTRLTLEANSLFPREFCENELDKLVVPYFFNSFCFELAVQAGEALTSSDNERIRRFADAFAFSSTDLAMTLLNPYKRMKQQTLDSLVESRGISRRVYREARSYVTIHCNEAALSDWESRMQAVLYLDQYVEEKARYALADSIGDVIMRCQIAHELYEAGLIADSCPFALPQQKLLDIAKEHEEKP